MDTLVVGKPSLASTLAATRTSKSRWTALSDTHCASTQKGVGYVYPSPCSVILRAYAVHLTGRSVCVSTRRANNTGERLSVSLARARKHSPAHALQGS